LALTCVPCGRIERLEGVMDGGRGPRLVNPEPLRAGGLLGQQVGGDRYGGGPTSWAVYDRPDRAPIGCFTRGRGLQGRQYFQARFDAWPGAQTVQARTAIGCLRELAAADRACVGAEVP
jgi:hypothetical protein